MQRKPPTDLAWRNQRGLPRGWDIGPGSISVGWRTEGAAWAPTAHGMLGTRGAGGVHYATNTEEQGWLRAGPGC